MKHHWQKGKYDRPDRHAIRAASGACQAELEELASDERVVVLKDLLGRWCATCGRELAAAHDCPKK